MRHARFLSPRAAEHRDPQPNRAGRYDELATQELLEAVRDAGVVGAGGAGFPTYKKLEARVEHVIANGAECEPLLQKDRECMRRERTLSSAVW